MSDEELAKDLGPLAALTIGVGTMIGAGIFVLPRDAYAVAGPAVALSFVVGGVISIFTALSASELGTAMPKAGGSYYYVNHALGPLAGSVAGLGNWIGLAFASAFYMLGFGDFVTELVAVPDLAVGPIGVTGVQAAGFVAGLVFVGVNYVGAKETGRLQNAIVIALVAILTVFAALGFLVGDVSTLRPFAPPELGGYGAVLPGTALVFVSFLGFAKITTVAEEIRNPGRNLPLAVVGSVVLVTAMYAVLMVVMASVRPWQALSAAGADPVVEVGRLAFGEVLGLGGVGAGLVVLGGLLATASSANASILASSRINFAMGRDALVTKKLNTIHPRFATPYRSIAVTGALILAFIVAGDVTTLAKAGSVLHLVVYGLLNVALLVMREATVPEYQPDFRVPLYPVTPILGALLSFGLIGFMDPIEILLAGGFVIAGVAWYALYARRHATKEGILGRTLREGAGAGTAAVAADGADEDDGYRVLVALANPAHERDLISLGGALAAHHGGTLVAVNVEQVPDQTALAEYREQGDHRAAHELLERAREDAETFGVPVETHTVLSHRAFEEIFAAARDYDADLAVMGWGTDSHGSPGRAESAVDDLAHDLPCDFLVLRDRGFDPDRVLVPTAGGPDSALSAHVATALAAEYGSRVTLLHVVDASDDRDAGEEFLAAWATDHGLADADREVAVGDVESAIETAGGDATMVVLGATERGLLSRLVRGSLVVDVADDLDCSVLLAERARTRGLWERLFG